LVTYLAITSRHTAKKFLVVLLLTAFLLPSFCFAASYDHTYELLNHPDGATEYKLTVSVTPTLYDYYRSRDHNLYLYNFAKFVTPHSLKPVADSLWSIYSDEEDFANGVLMIVHQIPYVESGPQKYPVETIVENEGDCDLFSFVAASIMMAGGLDVVLFFYESQSHMNVGVNLPHEPEDARSTVTYYSYERKRYYVAECTGGEWRDGWRVGETPETFSGVSARIITLEGYEKMAPGQVSSSYGVLAPSSLAFAVSSRFVLAERAVIMNGSISPAFPGKNVTLYLSSTGSPLSVLATVATDSGGRFSYTWRPSSAGIYSVRASWSGDVDYAGAESSTYRLTVVPLEWLLMGVTVIASLAVLLAVILATRGKSPEEPQYFGGAARIRTGVPRAQVSEPRPS